MFCISIDTPEIDVTPPAKPPPVVTEEAPPVVGEETPPESEDEDVAEESKVYSQYARVGRVDRDGRGSTLKNVTIVSNNQCSKPSSRNASDENYFCGELAQGENSVSLLA